MTRRSLLASLTALVAVPMGVWKAKPKVWRYADPSSDDMEYWHGWVCYGYDPQGQKITLRARKPAELDRLIAIHQGRGITWVVN